jgi:large subunit ribosomal protein L6
MKQKITEELEIPAGISCEVSGELIACRKDSRQISRKIDAPSIKAKVEGGKIIFECASGNKKDFKVVKSYIAHLNNIFRGLNEPFIYKLESCNVHFPMTLKIDKDNLIISNFLGEKTPRFAKILSGVNVELKGNKISVSSPNREAAGQTAANFERATKIRNRDRRIFQDGIFIVEKPAGGAK